MQRSKRFKLMGLLFVGAALTATAGAVGTKEIVRLRTNSLRTATLGYDTPGYNPVYSPPNQGYVPPVRTPGYVPPTPGYVPPTRPTSPGYVPPVRTSGYVPPVRSTPIYVPPVSGYVPPANRPGVYVPPTQGYVPPVRRPQPNITPGNVPPAKRVVKPPVTAKPKAPAIPPKLELIPAPWRVSYYKNIRRIGNSLYGVLKK